VQGTPFFEAAPVPHVVVPLTFENSQGAETYGTEISGEWRVTGNWRLTASDSFLQAHMSSSPGYDNNPQNQFQIRSYLDLPHHFELDGAVFYVDPIDPLLGDATTRVPSYVRTDLGVSWRPTGSLEVGVYGENLTDGGHPEFTSYKTTEVTEIPRSVMVRVIWHF
jgi:iron complex outermembrane receptor protein